MTAGGVKINLVNFWGRRIGKEKDIFWQDADMFVFPTFYSNECFPLVILEAMEKGVACISTEEGGIRDIIDDKKTEFITKRQDACLIAESIKKLIDNPSLRTEMAQAGRKRFEEKFTEQQFEKTMVECLRQCIV